LPNLQTKFTDPPNDNQDKNKRKHNYRNHLFQL
jgi:hypothetical protein